MISVAQLPNSTKEGSVISILLSDKRRKLVVDLRAAFHSDFLKIIFPIISLSPPLPIPVFSDTGRFRPFLLFSVDNFSVSEPLKAYISRIVDVCEKALRLSDPSKPISTQQIVEAVPLEDGRRLLKLPDTLVKGWMVKSFPDLRLERNIVDISRASTELAADANIILFSEIGRMNLLNTDIVSAVKEYLQLNLAKDDMFELSDIRRSIHEYIMEIETETDEFMNDAISQGVHTSPSVIDCFVEKRRMCYFYKNMIDKLGSLSNP